MEGILKLFRFMFKYPKKQNWSRLLIYPSTGFIL